jgi:hypothetical protein
MTAPLSFVTWKWAPPAGYRSAFSADTVNVLRRMVARHYPEPHQFLCVTDDAKGLDHEVNVVPAWNDFKDLPSPSGRKNPSCYRRLRAFAPDVDQVFGPRFVSLDLDTVITGDLRPLVHRSEDFVIWGDTNPRTAYNASMFLLTSGARAKVWETFDPKRSPQQAHASGCFGSDQGWISFCLGKGEVRWTKADGVYSYRNELMNTPALPENARIVFFHGVGDPWQPHVQAQAPWVREHYQ